MKKLFVVTKYTGKKTFTDLALLAFEPLRVGKPLEQMPELTVSEIDYSTTSGEILAKAVPSDESKPKGYYIITLI